MGRTTAASSADLHHRTGTPMLCDRTNGSDATLSFWQEAARRLNLARLDQPVTAATLDQLLERLREVSHDKVEQDYPFVSPLIRLFTVHDDTLFVLLEGYGEQTLDPEIHRAV